MNDDKRGIIFIFIGMSLFSIQDILVRKLSDVGSLIQVMTIRGLVGGLLLIWFLRATGRTVSIKSAYPKLAVIRVFIFFCGFLCFYFALGEVRSVGQPDAREFRVLLAAFLAREIAVVQVHRDVLSILRLFQRRLGFFFLGFLRL